MNAMASTDASGATTNTDDPAGQFNETTGNFCAVLEDTQRT